MSTYLTRLALVNIARRDVGKTEVSKNRAPWIEKLWPATSYPKGHENREPYCAAGVAYCVREWLKLQQTLDAFKMTPAQTEKWRCKSAAVAGWYEWAQETSGVMVLPKSTILHAGDLVIYTYSHIELVADDDGTKDGPFTVIGYNTDAGGSRDGEGCYEKPRSRKSVKCFIRMLQ
jgi:hypothetical protein